MSHRFDDPTPTAGTALANTAVALSTAATRLKAASELVDATAHRCAEAARLVDDYDDPAQETLLHELEDQLGVLAEAIHDTRRAMRRVRLGALRAMRKDPPG